MDELYPKKLCCEPMREYKNSNISLGIVKICVSSVIIICWTFTLCFENRMTTFRKIFQNGGKGRRGGGQEPYSFVLVRCWYLGLCLRIGTVTFCRLNLLACVSSLDLYISSFYNMLPMRCGWWKNIFSLWFPMYQPTCAFLIFSL